MANKSTKLVTGVDVPRENGLDRHSSEVLPEALGNNNIQPSEGSHIKIEPVEPKLNTERGAPGTGNA